MSASSSEEEPEITESLSLSAEEKKRIVLFYVCTSLLSTCFKVLKKGAIVDCFNILEPDNLPVI